MRILDMSSGRPPGWDDPKLMVSPEPFGYKTAWFAIRSKDRDAVAKALELQDSQEVNWQYGVHHAYEYNEYLIFVAPSVNGWVLAMGMPVVWEVDDYATERIAKLSRQFGEAQCFGSVRTSNSYSWALARDGVLVRHFYDADGSHKEIGEYTEEERTLGAKFSDSSSPEAMKPGYWERKDIVGVEEQTVLQVAGLWSVDPSKLDEMRLAPALGLLGRPSSSYKPKPEPIRRKKTGVLRRLFGR
jgi:hypothetical protein